jgi:hypothetical protein
MNALRIRWIALESGWRAGLKQYRKRLTELRKAPVRKTPAEV